MLTGMKIGVSSYVFNVAQEVIVSLDFYFQKLCDGPVDRDRTILRYLPFDIIDK